MPSTDPAPAKARFGSEPSDPQHIEYCMLPNKGLWSPPLDSLGNTVRGGAFAQVTIQTEYVSLTLIVLG